MEIELKELPVFVDILAEVPAGYTPYMEVAAKRFSEMRGCVRFPMGVCEAIIRGVYDRDDGGFAVGVRLSATDGYSGSNMVQWQASVDLVGILDGIILEVELRHLQPYDAPPDTLVHLDRVAAAHDAWWTRRP